RAIRAGAGRALRARLPCPREDGPSSARGWLVYVWPSACSTLRRAAPPSRLEAERTHGNPMSPHTTDASCPTANVRTWAEATRRFPAPGTAVPVAGLARTAVVLPLVPFLPLGHELANEVHAVVNGRRSHDRARHETYQHEGKGHGSGEDHLPRAPPPRTRRPTALRTQMPQPEEHATHDDAAEIDPGPRQSGQDDAPERQLLDDHRPEQQCDERVPRNPGRPRRSVLPATQISGCQQERPD